MILVCGSRWDPVIDTVCSALQEGGYPYRLFDLQCYPMGFQVQWCWEGLYPTGYIAAPAWRLDLAEVSGVYVRYVGLARLHAPDLPAVLQTAVAAECDVGLTILLEALPCPVVNRLWGSLSNDSKPYQALLIRGSGLHIPPTLVTTDPAAARRFYEEHQGAVICKSLTNKESAVQRVQVADLERLAGPGQGPRQFQAFIPGENIRVHTVGDQVFATLVHSAAVDYRYAYQDGLPVELEPIMLPPTVEAACLRLARQLGLLVAGIDLKRTPAGAYYCFEINPAPAFTAYERSTGQPIAAALADLLDQGRPGGSLAVQEV